jgi:hypothetical protein
VRDRERRHQRQAGVGDEREHPASPGAVSRGDHEPQFGQQPERRTSQGSAGDVLPRGVRGARRRAGTRYDVPGDELTAGQGGLVARGKKFAAVSSLLSAEMKPGAACGRGPAAGFSSRNSTRRWCRPSGSNQSARCSARPAFGAGKVGVTPI